MTSMLEQWRIPKAKWIRSGIFSMSEVKRIFWSYAVTVVIRRRTSDSYTNLKSLFCVLKKLI
jgi:hypothetical protein